jgi:hypothetical protein
MGGDEVGESLASFPPPSDLWKNIKIEKGKKYTVRAVLNSLNLSRI